MTSDRSVVALAQIAPVWLDRAATLAKIVEHIREAGRAGARLVAFGEGLLPGYPFWVEHTDGARFESTLQKELFGHYVEQAVDIHGDDLAPICKAAREASSWALVGCIERDRTRGHSVFCSLVLIDDQGEVRNVHRKLVPTHEERLVWSPGDGVGLEIFELGRFRLGALNCWENWMPLARSALYAQGEDLHVALWPGNARNTEQITPFIAREGRSFVLSVSGLLRREDIPDNAARRVAEGTLAGSVRGRWLLHRRSRRCVGDPAARRRRSIAGRRARPCPRARGAPELRSVRTLFAPGRTGTPRRSAAPSRRRVQRLAAPRSLGGRNVRGETVVAMVAESDRTRRIPVGI